ncbi:hypothetical protein [Rhizobium sp. BK176]|uniref:hypothetical protein n=1 Tax=Rhizobium sp. BK176 TaxID=2587071 RepID=UPI002168303D|nr:hypothetical protein [Rhizobium sp. BK176]MCS4089383.1 hypothetical protein [Rhizobium sp. BK176]
MLFKATYPAIVTSRPLRRPSLTRCVVRRETELEVPEVASDGAPVVMTIHGHYNHEVKNWGGPVPIRMIGEQHYMPLMKVERFAETLTDPFPDLSYSTIPHFSYRKDVFQPIRHRLYDELANYGGLNSPPWPSAIEHLLRPDSSSHIFDKQAKAFHGPTGRLPIDEAGEADIERCRQFFAEGFEGYKIIDGVVWRPIPEPCYQVDVDNGIISSVIPFGLFPSPYNPAEARVVTSATHFFAADSLDEAKAFSRAQGKDRFAAEMLETTGCLVEVLDDRALLGHDYAMAGLFQTAKEMRGWFGVDVPPEARETVMELRQAIDASASPFDVSSDLEPAVRAAVALEDIVPRWYNPRIDVKTARRIAKQLERQDSQAIAVTVRRPGL